MDKHFRILGRRHRIVNHDPAAAIQIAKKFYPNNPIAVHSSLLHTEIDEICSRDPDFRRMLEFLARFDKRKRR